MKRYWRWYSERPDEVLCDLDSEGALRRAERILPSIQAAYPAGSIWVYPSEAKGYHLILRLEQSAAGSARIALALRLGSDPGRAAQDLLRMGRVEGSAVCAPLLVTRQAWPDFWRGPDGVCDCERKHSDAGMAECLQGRIFRGGALLRPLPLLPGEGPLALGRRTL